MAQIEGFNNNFDLSEITYDNKEGEVVSSSKEKYYVTANDMNSIKSVVNKNMSALLNFSQDVKAKVDTFASSQSAATDEELDEIANKLGL